MATKDKSQQDSAAVTSTAAEPSATGQYQYCGPDYTLGVELPTDRALLRPRDWKQEEIADWIQNNPDYAHWFTQA